MPKSPVASYTPGWPVGVMVIALFITIPGIVIDRAQLNGTHIDWLVRRSRPKFDAEAVAAGTKLAFWIGQRHDEIPAANRCQGDAGGVIRRLRLARPYPPARAGECND